MDVQLRRLWLTRELSKSLCQFFLQFIVEVILLAEEYNAAL
jgi:hypothetical protein